MDINFINMRFSTFLKFLLYFRAAEEYLLVYNEFKLYYYGNEAGDEDQWLGGNAISMGSMGLVTSDDGIELKEH